VLAQAESLNPTAERHIFVGKTRESGARSMDQQHPQITVAALARSGLGLPPVVA
jgi:hypothetical protein